MKIASLVQKLQQFGWKCPGVTCISFLYYLSYKNYPLVTWPPRRENHTNDYSVCYCCCCARCHQGIYNTIMLILSALFGAVLSFKTVTDPHQPPLSAKHNDWTDDTRGHNGAMTTQGCTPPRILLYRSTIYIAEHKLSKQALWILWWQCDKYYWWKSPLEMLPSTYLN